MAKISITIDDSLLSRVDSFVSNNYITRSGLISMLLSQYLDSQDLSQAVKNMSFTMQMIFEKGEISAEEKKDLENFKFLVSNIYG